MGQKRKWSVHLCFQQSATIPICCPIDESHPTEAINEHLSEFWNKGCGIGLSKVENRFLRERSSKKRICVVSVLNCEGSKGCEKPNNIHDQFYVSLCSGTFRLWWWQHPLELADPWSFERPVLDCWLTLQRKCLKI